MVTRKDLARYRAGGPIWRRSVHRLPVWRPPPPPPAAALLPLHGVCRHTLARRLEARAELRLGDGTEETPEATFRHAQPAGGDGDSRAPI